MGEVMKHLTIRLVFKGDRFDGEWTADSERGRIWGKKRS